MHVVNSQIVSWALSSIIYYVALLEKFHHSIALVTPPPPPRRWSLAMGYWERGLLESVCLSVLLSIFGYYFVRRVVQVGILKIGPFYFVRRGLPLTCFSLTQRSCTMIALLNTVIHCQNFLSGGCCNPWASCKINLIIAFIIFICLHLAAQQSQYLSPCHCPTLMHGIVIHYIEHYHAATECVGYELAYSFFHSSSVSFRYCF